jgi:hypothetical protein
MKEPDVLLPTARDLQYRALRFVVVEFRKRVLGET